MKQESKNIWITGGGSGIGQALAQSLALGGHNVIISGRSRDKLEACRAVCPERIHPLVWDVSDESSIDSIEQQLSTKVAHLDCVILNAGICQYVDVHKLDLPSMHDVMNTNFFGFVHSFNAALALLKRAPRKPQLIGVASMASYVGFPRAQAYGASKAACAYLLNSIRSDCSSWLDVTVVNPGFVRTPLTDANDFDMPFLMSSEDAAKKIEKALSSRAKEIHFPWRLHALLRIAQWFPSLWYGFIVSKLNRENSQ
ncbi:MAG: SDR family NAD(P)-dependent oxidoreductase [Pseudohongiellaceae bacterium]|nr:SDR family NAD(P)-dependent oxidoreductase [Pseudohongiellaceae bacterium]